MFDVDRLLLDMETKGFCVLERLFDEDECAEMEQLLIDGVGGLDALGDSGGRVLHPLLSSAPGMAKFFTKRAYLEVMEAIFHDDVYLAHSGALVSDERRPFGGWHDHCGWASEVTYADTPGPRAGMHATTQRFDRILMNVYPLQSISLYVCVRARARALFCLCLCVTDLLPGAGT